MEMFQGLSSQASMISQELMRDLHRQLKTKQGHKIKLSQKIKNKKHNTMTSLGWTYQGKRLQVWIYQELTTTKVHHLLSNLALNQRK
jgi:hypothetical protein